MQHEILAYRVRAIDVALFTRAALGIPTSLASVPPEPTLAPTRGDLSAAWESWWQRLLAELHRDAFGLWTQRVLAPDDRALAAAVEGAMPAIESRMRREGRDVAASEPSSLAVVRDAASWTQLWRALERRAGAPLPPLLLVTDVPTPGEWWWFSATGTLLLAHPIFSDPSALASWLGVPAPRAL